MKKKITISIGIAAYNEENNIKNVLNDILSQKSTSWKLNKIFVACGGCIDQTVPKIQSIQSSHIRLLINPKREGKAVDEQKIFDIFKDEVLIMFDADVRLEGKCVIEDLVQVFLNNPDVDEVGGNPRPYLPQTFFEKAVYTTFLVLDKSRSYLKKGNNVYGASGQCIGLRKNLVKKITFPQGIVAEDDFIYFTNLSTHGKFLNCKSAIVRYKLPKKLSDYFKQVIRADPAASIANVERYFGKIVQLEYKRPLFFYFQSVLRVFLWNPIGTLYMVGIRLISRVVVVFTSKNYKLEWFTANSTK